MTRLIVALLALLGADAPMVVDFVTPAFSTHVSRDIIYSNAAIAGNEGSWKPLLLDLYEPTGDNAPRVRPAFLALHGGGWTTGTKRNDNIVDLCESLARRGYVCASADYRLLPDNPFAPGDTPRQRALNAAIEDTQAALAWLAANAALYRVDPARIAIGGSSAGAITALYVAYERKDARVRAVLSWAGGLQGNEKIITRGGPPVLIICRGLGHNAPLNRRPFAVSLHARIAHFLFANLHLSQIATEEPERFHRGGSGIRTISCPR